MIVEAVDPRTGKRIDLKCAAETEADIRDLLSFDFSEETLKKRLNSLSISADAKSLLFTIAKTTIKVGTTLVKIGRKILDVIMTLVTKFPMAGAGLIFGAVFGHLVASVPIIGFAFGPFIGTLALAFGFVAGAMQDFGNIALERRIKTELASFQGLRSQV